ncbi:MAG: NAD-dependent deacylase [Chloroflexaceae bacterium]|nr:NAD-dependent deacylase [Chloroflexaceae bacterium]
MTAASFVIPPELVTLLREAQHVAILTGAGTSAESGVPTFREAQTGLWAQYDPQQLATPEAFQRNPRLVWEWYTWRRELVNKAQPNPGHVALVTMEQRLPLFTLITQNVDGMHQRAGSQRVIELHGNINRTKRWNDGAIVEHWHETGASSTPRCPETGSMLRPDVVWFGETLPEAALAAAIEAAQMCDLFFSIGTSGVVQPAASLPMMAQRQETPVVVINPDVLPLTSATLYRIQGTSGQVLPALVQAAWPDAV